MVRPLTSCGRDFRYSGIDAQTEPSSRELQEIEVALAAFFSRGVETGHLAKAGLSECAGKAEARENSAYLG